MIFDTRSGLRKQPLKEDILYGTFVDSGVGGVVGQGGVEKPNCSKIVEALLLSPG